MIPTIKMISTMALTIKKMFAIVFAALMLFLTIVSATQAYSQAYPSTQTYPSAYTQTFTYYNYGNEGYANNYANNDYYGYDYADNEYYGEYANIPDVYGPFPKYYLGYSNLKYDDLDHYDNFVGYKDLDVFNPDGTIDVLRNPYATELDLSDLPEGVQTFGNHVYGWLPGCSMYKKHYGDDHAWDVGYDYGCTQCPVYVKTAPTTGCTSCQEKSACQLRHGC